MKNAQFSGASPQLRASRPRSWQLCICFFGKMASSFSRIQSSHLQGHRPLRRRSLFCDQWFHCDRYELQQLQPPPIGWRFLQHPAIRIYPAYWFAVLLILFVFLSARDSVMTAHAAERTDLWASLLLHPRTVEHVFSQISLTLFSGLAFYIIFIFAAFLGMKRRYRIPSLRICSAITIGLWIAFANTTNR